MGEGPLSNAKEERLVARIRKVKDSGVELAAAHVPISPNPSAHYVESGSIRGAAVTGWNLRRSDVVP